MRLGSPRGQIGADRPPTSGRDRACGRSPGSRSTPSCRTSRSRAAATSGSGTSAHRIVNRACASTGSPSASGRSVRRTSRRAPRSRCPTRTGSCSAPDTCSRTRTTACAPAARRRRRSAAAAPRRQPPPATAPPRPAVRPRRPAARSGASARQAARARTTARSPARSAGRSRCACCRRPADPSTPSTGCADRPSRDTSGRSAATRSCCPSG